MAVHWPPAYRRRVLRNAGDTMETATAEISTTDASASASEGGAPPSRGRFGVLRHRHYRNVFIGMFGSSLGNWMEAVGIQWIMTQIASEPAWVQAGRPSATLMMAYLGAAQLTPMLVLGLIGGLAADRMNRRTLLLVTQGAMMLIAAGLAVSAYLGMATPLVLMVLSGLQGVALAFNVPAWQVLTPRLVPREELTEAINLNGVQFNLARVIGPALGGQLFAWSGATVLFIINTVSFLGVMAGVATTPDAPAPKRAAGGESMLAEAWRELREALAFVFTRRGPRAAFLALVCFSVLATPMLRMLPVMVHEVYGLRAEAFGWMLAVMGGGAVAGGFLVKLVPKWYPKHHFIPLSVMLGGMSITMFAAMSTIVPAGIFLFLSGIFWMWAFNSSMAAMQLLVEDSMRGRVMAVCNTVALGAMPIGYLMAGWIGEIFAGHPQSGDAAAQAGATPVGLGAQVGVGVLAMVLACAGIVMLIWRTPEVDGMEPGHDDPVRRPGFFSGVTGLYHRPVQNGVEDAEAAAR